MSQKQHILFLTGKTPSEHAALAKGFRGHNLKVIGSPAIGDVKQAMHEETVTAFVLHSASLGIDVTNQLSQEIGSNSGQPIIEIRRNGAQQAGVPKRYRSGLINEEDGDVAKQILDHLAGAAT